MTAPAVFRLSEVLLKPSLKFVVNSRDVTVHVFKEDAS